VEYSLVAHLLKVRQMGSAGCEVHLYEVSVVDVVPGKLRKRGLKRTEALGSYVEMDDSETYRET